MTSHVSGPAWRKSSRSGAADDCVELADASCVRSGDVLVRDSKAPEGAVFRFGGDAFAAFLGRVKRGELDL